RAEGQGPDHAAVPRQHMYAVQVLQPPWVRPQAYSAIFTATGQQVAPRAECDTAHTLRMVQKRHQTLTALRIPDANRAVGSSTRHKAAIGAKTDRPDRTRVAGQGM